MNENNNEKFDELFENSANGGTTPAKENETIKNVETSSPHTMDAVTRETYTDEELRDVNNIMVEVRDTTTPIVVFFGSPASGKTLALLRMIRYLEKQSGQSYKVVADPVFRPQTDRHYAKMCNGLKTMAYSNYTPGGNDVISFMLVKILNKVGQPICQILEAPGEHYFDGSVNAQFPTYINRICSSPNRKIWVFFVEQDWGIDQNERDLYASAINRVRIGDQDKVIFLFNKADKYYPQQFINNRPNVDTFFKNIKNQYSGIFDSFENHGMTRFLYGQYNFEQICFSSGTFNMTAGNKEVWNLGDPQYCKALWDALPVPNK